MEEVEAEFSRKELKRFLENLAEQVETGRVRVQIPGGSKGVVSIVPRQPIEVTFHGKEGEDMSVTVEFKERREIED
jgi:amphi-Trp domain-containing protein